MRAILITPELSLAYFRAQAALNGPAGFAPWPGSTCPRSCEIHATKLRPSLCSHGEYQRRFANRFGAQRASMKNVGIFVGILLQNGVNFWVVPQSKEIFRFSQLIDNGLHRAMLNEPNFQLFTEGL